MARHKRKPAVVGDAKPTQAQIDRAYAAIPELQEPDRAARRAAFLVVIILVVVVGVAGAAIELYLKPLLVDAPASPSVAAREVYMQVTAEGYSPAVLRLRAGEQVRWIINATNASGCGRTILVPDLQISRSLDDDITVIEFSPSAPGKIPFSCVTTQLQGYLDVQ